MSRINGFVGRRDFIKFFGLSTLSISGISACSSIITTPSTITIPPKNPNPNPISPEEAQRRLQVGNRRFYNQNRQYPNQTKRRLETLSKAQYPYAAILGCADSRVPPELIFDQGLGDLFVVRVAGNVASNMVIGSLEYTTTVLGTQLIVVLGHKNCGAVAAAIKDQPNPGRIGFIVDNIKPALAQEQLRNNDLEINESAIFNNIQYQTERLLKNSSVLGQLVNEERLKIMGAYYDTDTGKVEFIN
ncbi:MAG: carbonic anhydrase [Nostocales cyanobacterium]|nr:MAG: carbonic anhydrase [Nostocales cyanobacterium]TAF10487.1 MAG: carbonic anhydrase [Nostocales cyanobacterium]